MNTIRGVFRGILVVLPIGLFCAGYYMVGQRAAAAAAARALAQNKIYYMKKLPIEGADAARLMGLEAYKWHLHMPAGAAGFTMWAEDWHKNVTTPKIYWMGAQGFKGLPLPDSLLISLPNAHNPDFAGGLTGSTGFSHYPQLVIDSTNGPSMSQAGDYHTLALDQSVLLAYVLQDQGESDGSTVTSGPWKNDHAVLYKMCIVSKSDVNIPAWKNGKIVFH